MAREQARLRAWLSTITLRCRGKAPGLAMQAIYSDAWPDEGQERPTTMPTPTTQHPDEEIQALTKFIAALEKAREALLEVHDARARRGVTTEALETDQDTLLGLEHGATNALLRRKRDVGTLLRSPFRSMVQR